MSSLYEFVVVAVGFLCFDFCSNLRVIPERVIVHTINNNYVDDVKFSVRRYNRKSGYYLNGEGTIKHTWGNNVSLHVVLLELLHNEYKPTFIEFHFARGCELIDKDPYIGKALGEALTKAGLTCPVGPGHYALQNMTILVDEFPYLWPFQRAKAVATVMSDNNFIGNGSLYLRFEQKKRN